MINLQEFKEQYEQFDVYSWSETINVDMHTPVTLAQSLGEKESFVLLESLSNHADSDRYTYLAYDYHAVITADPEGCKTEYANGTTDVSPKTVFEYTREFLARYRSNNSGEFESGCIGHMCYECVGFFEDVKFTGDREIGLPLARMVVPQVCIVLDHLTFGAKIIINVFKEAHVDADAAYQWLVAAHQKLTHNLYEKPITPSPLHTKPAADLAPIAEEFYSINNEDYLGMVRSCKDYIRKGHIFQVQISRRVSVEQQASSFDVYRYLRKLNPSPCMFFIKSDEYDLIGSSPEILTNVTNGEINIRPIAGTRKRHAVGQTEEEVIAELKGDAKECAEHIMLVDLARNDLARVSKFGSVEVKYLMGIEKYSHVIHMVSDVVGQLKEGYDAVDALMYSFPAGTVTGTPKIRAMEIIDEFENCQREIYAGGIVFFDFQGNLKSALVIRSLVSKDGRIYAQAAAGTVADSIPEQELLETRNKLGSSVMAVQVLAR